MGLILRALLARQDVRYLLVGVVNTAVGYGFFVLLELSLGRVLPYLVVLFMAHVLGVLWAFVVHRYVTFRVRGQVWADLARFWSVHLAGFGVNVLLLPVLVELLGLPVLVAQPAALLVVAFGTYTAHRTFSFRRAAEPDTQVVGG